VSSDAPTCGYGAIARDFLDSEDGINFLTNRYDIIAGILVGGVSRRMGQPKALIGIGRESLLVRTVRVASECVSNVVFVGTPPFEIESSLQSMCVVADAVDGIGPIGGLAGLLRSSEASWCLLLSCDMPFVEASLLRRLIDEAVKFDAEAVLPSTQVGSRITDHPCCAIYRRSILPTVGRAIESKQYSMTRLLNRLSVVRLPVKGDDARALANWNTPSDVATDTVTKRNHANRYSL
jgi:molybdopterin-guanine dinucleotide biosynthesis protein A